MQKLYIRGAEYLSLGLPVSLPLSAVIASKYVKENIFWGLMLALCVTLYFALVHPKYSSDTNFQAAA